MRSSPARSSGGAAQRYVEPFVLQAAGQAGAGTPGEIPPTWPERIELGREEVRSILGRIWPYLLAGVGLGAVIHGWMPADFFARYAGSSNPLAVPFAVLIGVPLYSNAAGVLPLVEALHAKGLAMGTLLAFMMAVVALSLPEMSCSAGSCAEAPRPLHRRRRRRDHGDRLPLQRDPLKGRHDMSTIKVLGPGCVNCRRLRDLTEQALRELAGPRKSRRSPTTRRSPATA